MIGKGNAKPLLLVLCGCVALLWSATLQAQTVVNPTKVQFTASTDQNTVVGGVAVLDHYDLLLIVSGTTTTAFTQGLGKPTPDASNTITVALSGGFLGAMTKNTLYTSTVNAVGSGGTSPSAASNPFVAAGPPAAATNVRVVP